MTHQQNDTVMVPEIGPQEADVLVANGAYLLDVRENDEWDAGHAPSAHHIVLGELGGKVAEVPADTKIVVICRSGGRSAYAAAALISAGFDTLNLTGGMQAWDAASLPVIDSAGNPGTVI